MRERFEAVAAGLLLAVALPVGLEACRFYPGLRQQRVGEASHEELRDSWHPALERTGTLPAARRLEVLFPRGEIESERVTGTSREAAPALGRIELEGAGAMIFVHRE